MYSETDSGNFHCDWLRGTYEQRKDLSLLRWRAERPRRKIRQAQDRQQGRSRSSQANRRAPVWQQHSRYAGETWEGGYIVESLECLAKEWVLFSGGFGAAEHLTKATL